MPGAFEGFGYFDPTAPQPDPDVLMSGVPRPAPYSHIPTTGEVRSLAPPTDTTRDRIAQGVFDGLVSLPLGGYSAGTNLAEGALEGDPWQMAGGGLEAMFLGLPGASRLTAAGKIKAGGPGSPEALERAKGAWAKGEDPRAVWEREKWASGKEFGPYVDGRDPTPVTWHGLPDLELKNYDPGVQRGAFLHRTEGTGDLAISNPELQGLPIETKMGQHYQPMSPEYENSMVFKRNLNTGDRFKSQMYLTARTPEEMRTALVHETQHAVDDFPAMDFDFRKNPIYGTDAQDIWNALAEDAGSALRSQGQSLSATDRLRLQNLVGGARGRYYDAPDKAAYLNAPHEIKARMAEQVYTHMPEKVTSGVYPGDLDAFAPQSFSDTIPELDPFTRSLGSPVDWHHYRRK